MKSRRKVIISGVLILLVGGACIYEYKNINNLDSFSINQITWDGEGKNWTDNTRGNLYDIKFKKFTGSDIKEISSSKDEFIMKIDSEMESGSLTLKIYTTEEVLYEGSGDIDKVVEISSEENNDVKIEIKGESAKAHIKIKLK